MTQRIAVVAVRSGETVASLAERSAFENYKRERFCVLNGLDACSSVATGERVKLVQ